MARGFDFRMQKLFRNPHVVFLALDHGFSMGPLPGLENLTSSIESLSRCNIDGIILHWGAIKNLPLEIFRKNFPPIIAHLAGSEIVKSGEKFSTAHPLQALLYGADAVSYQINIGTKNDASQVKKASKFIEQANRLELPTLLMIYDRREAVSDPEKIKGAVRLAVELGTDMVKIDVGKNLDVLSFASQNSPIPILVAGGTKSESREEFLSGVKEYLEHGARGISVGRNIFQDSDPEEALSATCDLVHRYGN